MSPSRPSQAPAAPATSPSPGGRSAPHPALTLAALGLALAWLPAFDCAGGADSASTLGGRPDCTAATLALVAVAATPGGLFVVPAGCAALGADGSAERPIGGDALPATVAAGRTLVLSPGEYNAPIALSGGAHLLAPVPGKTTLRAPLTIEGAGASTVTGLRVVGAAGVGVRVRGAFASLVDVRVEGVVVQEGVGAGHGVEVRDGGSLTASGLAVVSSAGVGILAKGAGAISIVEPIFDVDPRGDDEAIGIVEPIFAPTTQIDGNQGGGIAIVEPIFAPKGDEAAAPGLTLRGAWVRGNRGFGVALYGASAAIERSALTGTIRGDKGKWADGLLIAAGAAGAPRPNVTVDARSVIAGHERGGVMALHPCTVTVAADVSANGHAGLWVAAAGALLNVKAEARLFRNHLVGVAVASGADLQLQGAEIGQTQALTVDGAEVGDGVGVFSGARATIQGARIVDSARAAVIVHAAATTSDGTPDVVIDGSTFVGGQYAVVVNGAPAPDFQSKNSYAPTDGQARSGSSDAATSGGPDVGQGNADGGGAAGTDEAPKDRDNADLAVSTEACSGDDCAPAGDGY